MTDELKKLDTMMIGAINICNTMLLPRLEKEGLLTKPVRLVLDEETGDYRIVAGDHIATKH